MKKKLIVFAGFVLAFMGIAAVSQFDLTTQVRGLLGTANGGTNLDTHASTGIPVLLSGTWSVIDFPERYFIPAANCNNTTAGAGWSIGSGGTVTCRAGTNNLGGFIAITDTSSTFAQFSVTIP